MHELPFVLNIVNTVDQLAETNHITNIRSVVIELGEGTGAMPEYIQTLWPVTIEGTRLSKPILEIEMIPCIVKCRNCHTKYHLYDHKSICPTCKNETWDLLSGKNLIVKEIKVTD